MNIITKTKASHDERVCGCGVTMDRVYDFERRLVGYWCHGCGGSFTTKMTPEQVKRFGLDEEVGNE